MSVNERTWGHGRMHTSALHTLRPQGKHTLPTLGRLFPKAAPRAPPRPPGGPPWGGISPNSPQLPPLCFPLANIFKCLNSVWGTISLAYGLITFCLLIKKKKNTQKTWEIKTDKALSCFFQLWVLFMNMSISQMKRRSAPI